MQTCEAPAMHGFWLAIVWVLPWPEGSVASTAASFLVSLAVGFLTVHFASAIADTYGPEYHGAELD